MKKLTRMLLMMAVQTVGAGLISCGETIVIGSTDTPAPKPEPTPTPEIVVKATDLLKEAQKEGANVVFWYYYEGELFYAAFKKVGNEYVYQEGGNCNKASTRGVVTTELTAELLESKGDEGTADLGFNVYSTDGAGQKNDPIILCKVSSSTAEVRQKTSAPDNYLAAMGANIQNASMKTIMDEVKDIFNGDKKYQPDNKNNDLEDVSLVSAEDNTGQLLLKSLPEIVQNAAEQGISLEQAIGATIDNLQQKVAETYEDDSSKIPEIKFKYENPSVTWSSIASDNTYQQELQTTGVECTVTYSISDDIDNTCGAEIDTKSGKVTFEKPGEVKVKAVFTDTDGFVLTTSYTLTVNKAAGSISYPDEPVKKTTTDAAFTITLTKVGDGQVTYSSDKETVATVDENGQVTIKGVGEATITATVKDSETYAYATNTATYQITVTEAIIAVTGVSLNKTELGLTIDNTETLTATVAPTDASNKAVTWKSSKESVAKVDANGKVTAVGAGEAIITVTTTDGEKSAECKVTVSKKAGSISFATASYEKLTTDAAFTNTLTKTGDGSVTYSSDKETVAKVNETTGQVTITGAGEATITATVKDSDTYAYATKTATFKIKVVKPDSYGGMEDYNRNDSKEL